MMGLAEMLTAKHLRSTLRYEPETGEWIWLKSFHKSRIGTKAGCVSKAHGYFQIRIDGKAYRASRLAFLYMTGHWPKYEVDHRDMDRADCRWSNLRLATRRLNQGNVEVRSDNITGLKGVTRLKRQNSFQSRIVLPNGRREFIGSFKSATMAHKAYVARAKEVFGEFARS